MARNLHLTLLYIFKYTNSYSILTLIFKQRSDSQSLVYSKPNWLRQIVVSLSVVEVGVFVWKIVVSYWFDDTRHMCDSHLWSCQTKKPEAPSVADQDQMKSKRQKFP